MRKVHGVLLVLVMLVALPACGKSSTSSDTTETTGASAASTVDIAASEYSFDTKVDKVKAGIVTVNFANKGKQHHEATVLQIPTGKTVADVLKDLEPVVSTEGSTPIPDSIQPVGGIGEVKAKAADVTSKVLLKPGNYAFICGLQDEDPNQQSGPPPTTAAGQTTTTAAPKKPHFTLGMVKPFEVTGAAGTEALSADGTVTAKDYSFDVPTITAGKHTLVFKNDGPKQIHIGVFMGFPAGTPAAKVEEILKSFADPKAGPPAIEPTQVAEATVHVPGSSSTFSGDFKAGTYAVLCFINDRAGGPPHVAKGMYKIFTVA